MSEAANALAIPEVDHPAEPHVTIRVGRQGKSWHAVACIHTHDGPILLHARADQRAILRALVHNKHLRRWAERASRGAIPPGALDHLAAQVGFNLGDPFKALSNFKPLAKLVENVAHGRVLQDVTRQVGQVASRIPGVQKAITLGERAARAALGRVVNNPLWDMARTGISFIPGIGSGVSAGMAAAAAYGRGQNAQDIAMAAARGALPGGDLAKLAWDVGVGLAKNPNLEKSALGVVQSQLGNLVANRLGGAAGGFVKQAITSGEAWIGATPAAANAMDAVQSAFKAGLTVAKTRGRSLNRANAVALAQALPNSPVGSRVARIASQAMVQSHYRQRATIAYEAAQRLVKRLEAQDPFAFAEYSQLQTLAAQGQHKPRVALAVLEVVRRTNAVRAALPALPAAAKAS